MSDDAPEPDDEPRTFWYRCAWGHVEERELASEDAPPLVCGAQLPGLLGGPSLKCTAELHLYGPAVGEWRRCNEAREAELRGRKHAEQLLAAADAALADCSQQLDEARTQTETGMLSEGDLGARLVQAEQDLGDAIRERDEALRDQEAMRANAAAATHERDDARAEVAELRGQLAAHRSASADAARLEEEAVGMVDALASARADADGVRHQLAKVQRERREARDALDQVRVYLGREAARQGARGRERLARRLLAAGIAGEQAEVKIGHVEAAVSTDDCTVTNLHGVIIVTLLGAPLDEWKTAVAELRELYALDSDGPTLLRKAVYEIRQARQQLRELHIRSQGFTVVRDVNAQTEKARDKAMGEALAARDDVRHWKSVAVWAAGHAPINFTKAAPGETHVVTSYSDELHRRYTAAIESDWDEDEAAFHPVVPAPIQGPHGVISMPHDVAVLIEASSLVSLLAGGQMTGWRSPPLQVLSIQVRRNRDGDCYEALLRFAGARSDDAPPTPIAWCGSTETHDAHEWLSVGGAATGKRWCEGV